ncbi:hypothetical protein [Salinicola endophyticus]|uniref:hypothetical protein n=1 Tax=Salinicola endophyticus TaxID=1949083 RepID=UPI00165FC85A|nr:hypothetical protein [Salinicola endophyticus]
MSLELIFKSGLISQPLISYNFLLGVIGSTALKQERLSRYRKCLKYVEDFADSLILDYRRDGVEAVVDRRASAVCWLSMELQDLCQDAGVKHTQIKLRLSPEANFYPRTRFLAANPLANPASGQSSGYDATSDNVSSLAAVFFYAGQVASVSDAEYSKILLGFGDVLEKLFALLCIHNRQVGLDDLAAAGVDYALLTQEDTGVLRFWFGALPDSESREICDSNLRFSIVRFREMLGLDNSD